MILFSNFKTSGIFEIYSAHFETSFKLKNKLKETCVYQKVQAMKISTALAIILFL